VTDTIEIPCATHRTTHTLTPREAAVVIIVAFAYVEEAHAAPEPYSAAPAPFNPGWLCVKDMLHAARDGEGYYEHVTSLLGDDAIDYPDVTPHLDGQVVTGLVSDEADASWRDYTIEGDSVTCGSDEGCDYSFSGDEDRDGLDLGEAVDWAKTHVAEHAGWVRDSATRSSTTSTTSTPTNRRTSHAPHSRHRHR
jgi:hypothetical protein